MTPGRIVLVGALCTTLWGADARAQAAVESAAPSSEAPATSAPPGGSALPPAEAAPSASGEAAEIAAQSSEVKLRDTLIFTVRVPRAGRSAAERAKIASEALALALEAIEPDDIRTEKSAAGVVIFAGVDPIITLTEEDARLAGDETLDVHAASVAQQIREAVRKEKQRSEIATTVFSISLVVFFGLIALYLIRKVRDFGERARVLLEENAARIPAIRLQSIEVVRPALLRSTLSVALLLGRWLGQLGIAYAWLVVVLSLFESTRGYTDRLTGLLVAPLSALMSRLATSLPLLLVAVVAAVAVFVLVRFVGLFFDGVQRGETTIAGLPRDLAQATSLLVRTGIVVAAFVFAAPVVTGDPEGALARTGAVALGALGLSAVPLLTTSIVGVLVVYGRRLRVGEFAEIGSERGRIVAINLLEVVLEDGAGVRVRVPHVLSLVRPTRLLGRIPRVTVELTVGSVGEPAESALLEAARELGDDPRVELASLDRGAARYRLSVRSIARDAPSSLLRRAAQELERVGISLAGSER